MTERLYYLDPYRRTFEACVLDRQEVNDHYAVVLDATAFYPTGGGQPHDTGTLNGVPVVDVIAADDGRVIHVLDSALTGASVVGEVDWERRFDHMQQHTGQHILSQAFLTICRAETVSFHLGEGQCTIDLDMAPPDLGQVTRAERLANQIGLQDLPVIARFVDRAEVSTLPLRKMPTVNGPVRIVQVAEFDWSPCGGTHVSSTGQVGLIKVMRVERRKKESRVHFLCGWRALADYGHKQDVVHALTSHLTTSEDEIMPAVQRLEAEARRLHKALTEVQYQMLSYEVADWLAQARPLGDMRVVCQSFGSRDVALMREASRRLTEEEGMVVLLATAQPRPQFVFASSKGVSADMGELMQTACAAVGGRGGGRPEFAQGGAPEGTSVERALDAAIGHLRTVTGRTSE